MKLQKVEPNEYAFSGRVFKAYIQYLSESDKSKRPKLYEGLEIGSVKSIGTAVIIQATDTDPISALQIFKEEVEELIKVLKDKQ